MVLLKEDIENVSDEFVRSFINEIKLSRLIRTGFFGNESFFEVPDKTVQQDLKLHRAVLDRALVDYFHDKEVISQDVKDWLYLDNPEFQDACLRAEIDPDGVYKSFKLIEKIINKRKELGHDP